MSTVEEARKILANSFTRPAENNRSVSTHRARDRQSPVLLQDLDEVSHILQINYIQSWRNCQRRPCNCKCQYTALTLWSVESCSSTGSASWDRTSRDRSHSDAPSLLIFLAMMRSHFSMFSLPCLSELALLLHIFFAYSKFYLNQRDLHAICHLVP